MMWACTWSYLLTYQYSITFDFLEKPKAERRSWNLHDRGFTSVSCGRSLPAWMKQKMERVFPSIFVVVTFVIHTYTQQKIDDERKSTWGVLPYYWLHCSLEDS
jgi:hypothetical protein